MSPVENHVKKTQDVKDEEPQLGMSLVTEILAMEGKTLREKLVEQTRREHPPEGLQTTADFMVGRFVRAGFKVNNRHDFGDRIKFDARIEWQVAESNYRLDLDVRVGVESSWEKHKDTVSRSFLLAIWEVLGQWNPDTRTARHPNDLLDRWDRWEGRNPTLHEQAILSINAIPILVERRL